jgi:hypothetical protein
MQWYGVKARRKSREGPMFRHYGLLHKKYRGDYGE